MLWLSKKKIYLLENKFESIITLTKELIIIISFISAIWDNKSASYTLFCALLLEIFLYIIEVLREYCLFISVLLNSKHKIQPVKTVYIIQVNNNQVNNIYNF